MDITIEKINNMLEKYNQKNVIRFYEELNYKQKEVLLNQIARIDFKLIKDLVNCKNSRSCESIEPIPFVDREKIDLEKQKEYIKIGEDILKQGKFAFVVMAGGQGTRLGHDGPKGTFMLGIENDKSLFEIMCDRLKQANSKYNMYIPWYIMTSRENNDDTIAFFKQNNYFDYPKECIKFFKQEELPMTHLDGTVILESKYKIKEAADGHGGVFNAIKTSGIIKDIKERKIEWIFIGGIDNVLLNMVDPLFIGMAEKENMKIASKSITKLSPQEKVGVFCKRNGKPSVVEYSEITDEMANLRDENGDLHYGEAHILCNLFRVQAIEKICNEKLPYHKAIKRCDYIDENGELIISTEPNAYKFESFIFDAFCKFDDILILRCPREKEFAPIKNKEGADSPESAKKLYNNYWKS